MSRSWEWKGHGNSFSTFVHGRRIDSVNHELITGTNYDAGIHTVPWNGTDAAGRKVASGVYFYRFVSGAHEQTGRMMLLK